MCKDMFPGCRDCIRVGSLDSEIEYSKKVVENPGSPQTVPGSYMCGSCGSEKQFYNHEKKECFDCSTVLPGCSLCSSDGAVCTECTSGFSLKENGLGCIDCGLEIATNCARCDTKGCLKCDQGWSVVRGYCTPNVAL